MSLFPVIGSIQYTHQPHKIKILKVERTTFIISYQSNVLVGNLGVHVGATWQGITHPNTVQAQPLMATAHSDGSGAPSNSAQEWHKEPDKELKDMASTWFNICGLRHNKSDPWRLPHGSAANALIPDTPRGPVSMPWWVRAKSESL